MRNTGVNAVIRNRLRRSGGPDRGGMSISMAIVFPCFMLLLLGIIQGCLWWYAREAALHAAKEGVEAGRQQGGSAEDAQSRAKEVAGDLGGGTLRGITVTLPVNDGERMEVQVRGTSLSIVPGLPALTIEQHANAPMERWTTSRP